MLTKRIYKSIKGLPTWYYYCSNSGKYIRKVETGTLLPFAIDRPIPKYTYEETDIPLPTPKKKSVEKNETTKTE